MDTANAYAFIQQLRAKGHLVSFVPPSIVLWSPADVPLEPLERGMLLWGRQAITRALVGEATYLQDRLFCEECATEVTVAHVEARGTILCQSCFEGLASVARLFGWAAKIYGDHSWSPN